MPKRYIVAVVNENTEQQWSFYGQRSFAKPEDAYCFSLLLKRIPALTAQALEMEATMTSPALRGQSPEYPVIYNGRVPKRVRMLCTVYPDDFRAVIAQGRHYAVADRVYDVWVDSDGTVSAIFDDGTLLKLNQDEFEVIAWHDGI